MAYEICKRCGSMFEQNGRRYCKDCFQKVQGEYDLVIGYIREHPQATILDIIVDTGVEIKTINCLVEEGYVSYVDNQSNKLDIMKLGKVLDKMGYKQGGFHISKGSR